MSTLYLMIINLTSFNKYKIQNIKVYIYIEILLTKREEYYKNLAFFLSNPTNLVNKNWSKTLRQPTSKDSKQ